MTPKGSFHPKEDAEGKIPASKWDNPERKGWQEIQGEAMCDLLGNAALFLGSVLGEGVRLLKMYFNIVAQSVGREGPQDGQLSAKSIASSLDA